MKLEFCCPKFEAATKDGTDSEGYGPALYFEWTPKTWHIGGTDAISFCPWCGRKIEPTQGKEQKQ